MEHRINSIEKRALKLVSQDSHDLTFQELLTKDKSIRVHQKNLQLLINEIFKSKTGVSPELMNDIFHFVEKPYNLRSDYTLERKRDHTVYHGSESLSSLAHKLWNLLPNLIKNSASLKEFKTKINTWELIPFVLVKHARNMTVCSCHVTYAFESESTLYSCLNVKELLARSRREI